MSQRRIQATPQQAKQLLDDVRARVAGPPGDHLAAEEFVSYALETLDPEQTQRVDEHLATCVDCTTRLEKFLQTSEAWRGAQGAERLAALRARVAVATPPPPTWLEEVRAFFASFAYPLTSPLTAHASTTAPEPFDFASSDGRLSLFVRETEEGDLILSFDSSALELEGETIGLYAGEWQRTARLVKVPNEEFVAAEIRLSRADRLTLPANVILQVRLVGMEE